MRWIATALLLATGCLRPGSGVCADGTLCPEGGSCATGTCRVVGDAAAPGECAEVAPYAACPLTANAVCIDEVCTPCSADLATCPTDGWERMTSAATVDLKGVWVASDREAFAVGGDQVLHWDGRAWSATTVSGANLQAVWGSDAGNVFAVSIPGEIYHLDAPGTWVAKKTSATPFHGVSGSSASDVLVVGNTGAILSEAGNWAAATTGRTDTLAAVWAQDADVAYAVGNAVVGSDKGVVLRRAAGQWTLDKSMASSLRAVSGSDSTVIAIGDGTLGADTKVYRRDATGWHDGTVPTFAVLAFYGAWVDATTSYVVGQSGAAFRHDGTAWSSISIPVTTDLGAIDGADGHAMIVGDGGTILRRSL